MAIRLPRVPGVSCLKRMEMVGRLPVAGAPAPTSPPTHDEEEPPDALVRDAVVAMFAGALERHVRRLKNRREDLARNAKLTPGQVTANLARETRRSLDLLARDCEAALRITEKLGAGQGALALLFEEAQRLIELEAEPSEVAARLVSNLLPASEARA